MATCIGPKLKFELLQNKIVSFNYIYELEYQDQMQKLMEKKVSFADSSIVFLHYSEEQIFHFRERLRAQLQQEKTETLFLNPSLFETSLQSKTRSCFKPVEN
ncbi:unnamed protein product [Paramecium primaurelia]|uniref:Uncharacterized protein n=1 Tax=Paramecium primaurelia TaxID=5886 RepID=A0A8S1Q6A9_PARPR|nr:unnamed protein product [Paramecium primaurelia]